MIDQIYMPDGKYWKGVSSGDSPINLSGVRKQLKEQLGREEWKGYHNVSIIGLRTDRESNKVSDRFQDWILFTWKTKLGATIGRTNQTVREWYIIPATTLAGIKMYKNPINAYGTAQVPLGFHRQIWKIGQHKGKNALSQIGNQIRVIIDNDGDEYHDFDDAKAYIGWYGINLHTANKAGTSTVVGGWSAGCQVTNISQPLMTKLINKLKVCEKRTAYNKYSYFLLRWQDEYNS